MECFVPRYEIEAGVSSIMRTVIGMVLKPHTVRIPCTQGLAFFRSDFYLSDVAGVDKFCVALLDVAAF